MSSEQYCKGECANDVPLQRAQRLVANLEHNPALRAAPRVLSGTVQGDACEQLLPPVRAERDVAAELVHRGAGGGVRRAVRSADMSAEWNKRPRRQSQEDEVSYLLLLCCCACFVDSSHYTLAICNRTLQLWSVPLVGAVA